MLRTKMIGALIRKTRQDEGKSVEDTAQAIALNPSVLNEYESGQRGIPLPDLELLCQHFEVDIQDILANKAPGKKASSKKAAQDQKPDVLRSLRQRIIAAQLRKLRQEQVTEIDVVAEAVGLPPETIEPYERGTQPIPLPELEALSSYYEIPFDHFMVQDKPAPEEPEASPSEPALDLPDDLLAFVRDPKNLPYLRLAVALRQMPEEELRRFAQSIMGNDS
jgi:transcriptional regulator with XRE-family HTH domain